MADAPRSFRAMVVDDEPAARATLLTLLADEPSITVIGEATNGDEAVRRIRALRPDLVFLDIQMPDRDGFGVIEALGDDVPPGIVFVTAYDEHALRAFEVHALDYLLKPFGRPRFRRAVEQAVRRLRAEDAYELRSTLASLVQDRNAESEPVALLAGATDGGLREPRSRFAVRAGDRTLIVNVADVRWIEAERDYARLHTASGVHLIAERMHALEGRLDTDRWCRIHRSTLVNLSCVRELRRAEDGGGIVVLDDGVRLRVARGRWGGLEKALQIDG